MKEQMRQFYKILLLSTIVMLQACGSSEDKRVFTISADVTEAKFSNEFLTESTSSIEINVEYFGDGLVVGFAPETDIAPWLQYRTGNVTDTTATIYVDVINGELLLPNTYSTKLRIATSNDDSSKFAAHDIDVSLLIWSLVVDTEKVKFSGTFSDTSIPSQTIAITSETNEWTASTDVDWLSLDVISDSGDGEIIVTPDISSFEGAGLQQGNIVLTEVTSGDTKLVPVDLALDNIYIIAERPAVALTSTNNISALETTIAISSNGEYDGGWQASTEADWLTLTPIGDSQLKITANAGVAPLNQNSLAQVVISATQDDTIISDLVSVNFYNSNLQVENLVLQGVEANDAEIVTSPLKPVFYVAVSNQLLTYHQYSGELVSTLSVAPEDTLLEQLIIHPKGEYLLAKAVETVIAEDETTTEVVHRYRVSLENDTITEILDANIITEPTNIIRLSNRYFVVTQALEFADEELNVLYWDGANAFSVSEIDTASQANSLYVVDSNAVSFKRYIPQTNDFGDDKVSVTLTHEYLLESLSEGQFIFDFMVTNDESNIYLLSQASEWISFDGTNFTDHGLLESSESVITLFLEKNSDSQPNYLRFDQANEQGFYLDIYDNNQIKISTTLTEGRLPTSIKLSGDSQRLFVNVDASDDPEVESQVEITTISH